MSNPSPVPASQAPLAAQTKSPRQRVVSWLVQILLLVAVLWAVSAFSTRNAVSPGSAVPEFQLQSLDGRIVSAADLRGKRVLLHFWATWCGVCRLELSNMQALHADHATDSLVISIAADQDVEKIKQFAQEHQLAYPILIGTEEVLHAFGVNAFPTNFYIDSAGKVHSVTVGLSSRYAMALRLWLAR